MDSKLIQRGIRVIFSCKTYEQLDVARAYVSLIDRMHGDESLLLKLLIEKQSEFIYGKCDIDQYNSHTFG